MHKNGHRPDKPANEMTTPKRNSLTIDVSIKDTEVFKDFIGVVSKIVMDQRMPAGLRDDAMQWLGDLNVSAGTVVGAYQPREYIIVLCGTFRQGKAIWETIKHKYNPNAKVRFIGQGGNVDGLRPDKVVRLRGWEESAGALMDWLTLDGNKTEVIDETGDHR
jgi:hypothetical protein